MNALLAYEWLFSQSVVERLGWVLVHSLWQFGLVVLLAGAGVASLRRSSSAMRYGVLVAAMAVSIAAPAFTWMMLPGELPVERTRSGAASAQDWNDPGADSIPIASAGTPASDAGNVVSAVDLDTARVAPEMQPATLRQTPALIPSGLTWMNYARSLLQPWLAWIVVAWSMGVIVCSGRPLLGWYTLRRLRRVGVSPVSHEMLAGLRRVSDQLGLRRAVGLLQSRLTQVPIVIGYFRPVILLPVSLATNIPAVQLDAILAHELAHVQRHDFVVNLLQTLVETLFFYHPAIWWLSRRIRVEREHCCDDRVVALLGNRVEYGRALIAIEQRRGHNSVLALGATDGSLLSRVRRIAGFPSDRRPTAPVERWPAALLGIALLGISSALSMAWNVAASDDAAHAEVTVPVETASLTDAETIAKRFLVALKEQQLPFLDERQQEALHQELQDAVAKSISKPLSPDGRAELSEATAAFVKREFDPAEKDALYLAFRDRFETLKWGLGIAVSRSEPTPEQAAQLALQRDWMRAEIEKLPESPKFGLRRKDKLAELETLFNDPLNPFFQEPMSDADFKQFQTRYLEAASRDRPEASLSFASSRLLQSALDVLREKFLQRWPVKNSGWRRANLRWSLVVIPPAGNETLSLNDANTHVRDVYVDVLRMIFVPDEAPAALGAGAEWLQQQGQGDLAFDAKRDAFVGVRGAKLAVLEAPDWFSADRIPLADLRKLIETAGKDSVPLSLFIEADGDPANGIKRLRPIAPSLVIRTQEGRISVIRIWGMAGNDPVIKSRPRPLSPNPPLHPGDVEAQPGDPQAALAPGSPNTNKAESLNPNVIPAEAEAPPAAMPTLRVTGRVLDAETGLPIMKCRMIPGPVDRGDSERVTWQSQYLKEFTDGRFLYETERPWEQTRLRIEAEGYRPATTRVVEKGESAELDVKLEREILAGVVRLPNGTPAAKAQVALASWTNEVSVKSGRLSYIAHAQRLRKIVETDEQGRFLMPAEIDPWVVVVAHDAGYAEISSTGSSLARKSPAGKGAADAPEETAVIELRSWGRVAGRVLLGETPVVGAKYWVYQARVDDVHVHANENVETDAEGRFVVEKLPPGRNGICQRYSETSDGQGGQALSGLLARFDVPAGQTATLALGSPGRTVIGKLSLPVKFPHKIDWRKVTLRVSLPLPPFRPIFMEGSDESWQAWSQFLKTEEGKSYGRDNVAIAADGSFRIDGLPAADYELSVEGGGQAVIDDPQPAGVILRATREFSLPADSKALPPAPVDLGTIKLTDLERPQADLAPEEDRPQMAIWSAIFECNIVDEVTGKPISNTTTSFHFIKPKSGDAEETTVATVIWGPKRSGHIRFTIPDQVLRRADREELEVRWGTGNHPDYEDYSPAERIPLKQFFIGDPKSARETLRTIKLTPKNRRSEQD